MKIMDALRAISPKKWLIIGISAGCALLILLGCLFLLPGNGKPAGNDVTPGETATLTIKNALDAPLAGVQVYIYTDKTLSDLVNFATTDAEGKMSYVAQGSGNVAVLKGVAAGYQLEEYYPLESDTTIVLEALASTADGALPTDAKLELGDPMVDFTFTDLDGVSYTASEVLKEKKALVLNFWYTTCGPCASEFPYLQTAYNSYKDSLTLLAVDSYGDPEAEVKKFREDHELTLPMAVVDTAWNSLLNINAYPTTVVIDRYGFIAFYHVGAVTEEGVFEKLFAYYTAEDYVHTATSDFDELTVEEDEPSDPEDTRTEGTKDSPIEIGSTLTFDAEVPAGKTTYYDVYKVSGTILTLKSEDATITYDGKTYEPENGVITFPVETDDVTIPVKLIIGNKGDKDATFKVEFAYPAGTMDNPLELKMGDLTVNMEKGNEKGMVYEYTATQSGTVTMKVISVTKGVECGFSLYNLNTSAYRTLDEDGSDDSVSIEMNKGDVLQVTVGVMPDENNEYPAATIKAKLSFKGGSVTTKPTQSAVTYKVTVKAEGKVLSGVKLAFAAGSTEKKLTTDSKGVASLKVKETDCTVTMTVPKGYIAEKLQYQLTSANPTLVINLTKEEEISTEVGETPTDYKVTVIDGAGKAQKGVTVNFYLGEKKVESKKTDAKGVVSATLLDGTYVIKLTGTKLKYDEKSAIVSVAKPSTEILLANEMGTSKQTVTCPVVNKPRPAYEVAEGATYVTIAKPGERNYFLFTPERSGTFRISVTTASAKVGYYGGTIHYVQSSNLAEVTNNAFTVSVKDVGPIYVLGIDAPTNVDATVLRITRVGDAAWDVSDEPWTVFEGTHTPKSYTLPSGTKLEKFDITAGGYKLVYNSTDGYYHKDTKNGPIVYLNFGADAPYVSFGDILNKFHVAAYMYDASGNFVKKEEYTECMMAYFKCVDATTSVYPLTKDLEYIIKAYGEHQGWWIEDNPGYLFADVDKVNLDIAWMFALCYAK